MGNSVGSVVSGIGQIFGNIFGHPLDFLSGKSCNSVCAPTWDFLCYIENFCVSQLLKFAMVSILVYFVLLFFYLIFNLGIFQCICRTLCHIVWAFFSAYFSALHCCCTYCGSKLHSVRRRRRRRRRGDVEESVAESSGSAGEDGYELGEVPTFRPPRNLERGRSQFSRRKNYKDEHLRRSLRPNSHRARVELSSTSVDLRRRNTPKNVDDHVRVARSSRFSRKGSKLRNRTHHRR